jgi:plastocyanin
VRSDFGAFVAGDTGRHRKKRKRVRAMNPFRAVLVLAVAGALAGCMTSRSDVAAAGKMKHAEESCFLPGAEASRIVSVTGTNAGPVAANILVQTHAVVVKEGGPKDSLARFGEVYAFSPTFIAVHREEPALIRFWNLQGDDDHDFMLVDPHAEVLMKVLLPPLRETAFVFTFHEEGLFNFLCAMHQPAMNGQILVLPPRVR